MTAPSVSLLPHQVGAELPAPSPVPGLTDEENRVVFGLQTRLTMLSVSMVTSNLYYDGLQRLTDLGVSIPENMRNIRTVVDWPRICIDPLAMRQVVDGFRVPDNPSIEDELWTIWQENNLDAEAPLCYLDSLVYGRGYMIVGAPDTYGDTPLVTVESPLNMATAWDPRTRRTTAAFQSFQEQGVFCSVLYMPDRTVSMSRDSGAMTPWTVDSVDEHGFGEVPVVRFANRQRASDREGRSEITPAVMNTTDSVVRTLLGMEIAREFYSVPHRYGLGLQESDFVGADGNPKSGLQMTMSKFLAFERDENGNVPTVGQFTAADPAVFTKIVDKHAQLLSSYTGFPPEYFGVTSTANPASADAIRVAYDGMNRRGKQVQGQNSDPTERVMALAWRFNNSGAQPPKEMRRMETDWVDVETFTPGAAADAMFKQVQMGAVPPTSPIVLKRLGYSRADVEQITADRKLDAGASVLAELASSLQAKEARADVSVARDINPKAVDVPAATAADPATTS